MTKAVEVIYENKHFTVSVGTSEHSDKNIQCYQVVSKQYGIVERETSILITALHDAQQMSEALDDFFRAGAVIDLPTEEIVLP